MRVDYKLIFPHPNPLPEGKGEKEILLAQFGDRISKILSTFEMHM